MHTPDVIPSSLPRRANTGRDSTTMDGEAEGEVDTARVGTADSAAEGAVDGEDDRVDGIADAAVDGAVEGAAEGAADGGQGRLVHT